MTPCMSSRYSNQLSYTLTTDIIIAQTARFVNPFFKKIFSGGKIRQFFPQKRLTIALLRAIMSPAQAAAG